jgi:hypothetical protein
VAPSSTVPDSEQVQVVASGIGAFKLQAYPVAILHNLATSHTATQVVATFTVGSYVFSAEPVSLAPGETLADTALCTDACDGATAATVSVTVGSWVAGGRTVISGTSASYTCEVSCGGAGASNGNVSGTLSGRVPSGTLVNLSAVCDGSGGSIVGGGLSETIWPAGASTAASVSVLVSSPPASCQLYATEAV